MRSKGLIIRAGRFQESMQVESVNDGPVTILLESPAATTLPGSLEPSHGSVRPPG
ncbi:MAG TPA: D-aminoacyl-tRNA deacylase [Syntrophobacteria bacterium]|nr:D-aminoacyl-tRNA deacylase [Syntrophobacteria bacterium]